MSRLVFAVIGVLALVLGLGIGVGAGMLAQAPGTVAVVGTPSAVPAPTGPASTGPAPSVESPSTAPTPEPTPEHTPTPVPTPTPEPTPVPVPAPLTGVPVTDAIAARHVIAIMIDDLSAARPQSGLSQADVVWQAPAEGGIPRYEAWFQSRYPTQVGPIRSSRLYFIAWAAEWRAVYVHAGGSPQALALLNSSKGHGKIVYNADEFRWARYLYRVTFKNAPHNVFSDDKNLRKLAKAVGAKAVAGQKPHWTFAADAPLEQRPQGGKLLVPYLANRISYSYDRRTNTYLRSVSVEGKQFDAGTKPRTRIAPKNVVIVVVRFVSLGDKKHRLDGQVTGSGTAWIATNGRTIKGTWKKKSFTAPIRFYRSDGTEVTLTMGQTFVQVVQSGTKITIKDGKVPTPATASPSPSPSTTP
jgi:hypothetical protein